MDQRRTWTMTLAGGASILLGALGILPLLLAGWLITAIFAVVLLGAALGRHTPEPGTGVSLAFGALGLGVIVAVFAGLDLLLLATGLSIWRVSRSARTFAVAYAAIAIPLGVLDLWISSRLEQVPNYLAPLTLFTPSYALALLLAFSLIPSWRQSLRRAPWKPRAPPASFSGNTA